MKTKIEIEIENLKVTTDAHNTGYYYFDWFATVNGKKKKGNYDSSYSGQSAIQDTVFQENGGVTVHISFVVWECFGQ